MRSWLAFLSTLLICSFADAAPTCIVDSTGGAPVANITFSPPTTQGGGSSSIPTGTALTYNLYQGTASGTESKVASSTGAPIKVSTGIADGATYYWYVTTSDANGEGPPSNEVCKTFHAPVPDAVTITITQIAPRSLLPIAQACGAAHGSLWHCRAQRRFRGVIFEELAMSRIVSDANGSYDLSQVVAITKVPRISSNTVLPTPLPPTTKLWFEGTGGVQTLLDYAETEANWLDVKTSENHPGDRLASDRVTS